MSASSPPDSIRTLDLHGGGLLVLAGPDTEIQITILDSDGNGGSSALNMVAAEQVQNALLDRILHIQARERGKR